MVLWQENNTFLLFFLGIEFRGSLMDIRKIVPRKINPNKIAPQKIAQNKIAPMKIPIMNIPPYERSLCENYPPEICPRENCQILPIIQTKVKSKI